MDHPRLQKYFGVGPIGAGISIILLLPAILVNRLLGHPEIVEIAGYRSLMAALGVLFICMGLFLHFWTMYTLRNWWVKDRLCTGGPFKWFRHPMYAAWITYVSLGVAFYRDSWVLLAWVIAEHAAWHWLVIREERVMEGLFQAEYPAYARKTGRFVPRLRIPGRRKRMSAVSR